METLPFITATKRIKYFGINLPKEAKELYAENYKTHYHLWSIYHATSRVLTAFYGLSHLGFNK